MEQWKCRPDDWTGLKGNEGSDNMGRLWLQETQPKSEGEEEEVKSKEGFCF